VFFDDLLISNIKPGYLISRPSNALEQGGLVAGASMDDQLIGDMFQNVAVAG
jgi:alpha-L-fucosidase 2